MQKTIKIKRGLDIRLEGEADRVLVSPEFVDTYLINPSDFHGVNPRLVVKEGDEVKAGSSIFTNKSNEKIAVTSPVSGEVVEIIRGEKRKLLGIKILADKENSFLPFNAPSVASASRDEIIQLLLESGAWTYVKQRPFDVIANPNQTPRAIFISAFDSSPLAPDYDYLIQGSEAEFQTGLDALAKLTSGKVHLGVHSKLNKSDVFLKAKNVQINYFDGPHPSGNVGIQIHHISPINKGEVIWTVNAQDVAIIGRLFTEKRYNTQKTIAVTGSEVLKKRYAKVYSGTRITQLVQNNVASGELRYISGNVLTGTKISADGYLGHYHYQITVIPEVVEPEFLGWQGPGFNKFSLSTSFPTFLLKNKKYRLNTNLNGEERAFVVTGQYEKVLPMDILPMQLIKSIMANDIEMMEGLGIYEVAPEDFALCEFVCTSKINSQSIVRKGLDLLLKEMN
jgi:Na+-transporting NADH:ubiquinone oxidoreductase subunit A